MLALGAPSELASKLVGRQTVEIEVSPDTLTLALNTLEALPGTAEVKTEGDRLKLSEIDRQQIPEIIAKVAAAGVRIFSVTTQEPSLEDVYFTLHEKSVSAEKELP